MFGVLPTENKMGLKDMVLGIILTGLFLFSIMSFGVIFADDQDSTHSIADDEIMTQFNSSLHAQLETVDDEANTQKDSQEESFGQANTESETFGLVSILVNVYGFIGLMFGTMNVLVGGISGVLGIPSIVVSVILGGLTIIMVLLAWRVWKAGGT